MNYIYINCGTTTSRGYLVRDGKPSGYVSKVVGTKDSSLSGGNDILLAGLREIYDVLIDRNGLFERDIESVWISGMATSPFGITEIPHMTMPVNAQKMYDESVTFYEESYFDRELRLLRGVKNVPDGTVVDLENIEYISSIRGEEIDIVGLLSSNYTPEGPFVVVAPSSHTQFCYVKDGALTDILSSFTGELRYALSRDTMLYGEQEHGDVAMTEQFVRKGCEYLRKYGFCRAVQIVHGANTFGILSKAERTQILNGIITGSVTDLLAQHISKKWTDVEEIVIFGGKPYIEAYQILLKDTLPSMPVRLITDINGNSFALSGFLELLKIEESKTH